MFGRLWRYIKSLFGAKQDETEKPVNSTSQTLKELKQAQSEHRDRALQAVSEKNTLQSLATQTQRTIDNLQTKADLARKNGDTLLADQLLAEKEKYEGLLAGTTRSLESAKENVENVKASNREDQKRIYHEYADELRPTSLD